jgi:hypothetical protein
MLRVAMLAAAALLPAAAPAASPSAPLVLQFPDTMQAGGNAGAAPGVAFALIGAWANAALNEQSAERVEAFRVQAAAIDFASVITQSFRCVGVPAPRTACRASLALPDAPDDKQLAAQLAAQGFVDFLIVDVVPLLTPEHFRVRALAKEMSVTPKGLRVSRQYAAIYDTRAPADLVAAGDVARLQDYWREGSPARIEQEAVAAAEELERALSFLSEQLEANGGKPVFVKQLPDIKELEASGRAACRGMCGQVRVVRTDPRIWITSTAATGAPGAVIASLDANSAQHSVNLFGLVLALD